MRLTPDNTRLIGDGLDHPEGICLAVDGSIYVGSEAGQVVHLQPDGGQRGMGSTGGFLLGIALDGANRIHACDCGRVGLFRVDPDGTVVKRSTGTAERSFTVPNFAVFDVSGNLYVSDSGDYWDERGTGCIMKVAPDDTTTLFHAGPFRFANGLAIDPTGEWLYVVQSTAPDVVRIPLAEPHGDITVSHRLPAGTVPDGLAFSSDGRLVIACYKPDMVYVGYPNGRLEVLCDDPTGELLSRPTNVAIGDDGTLFIANLGGWHVTAIDSDLRPAPIHRPDLNC